MCLLPFPNDYFTRADATTATGRRLNLALEAMPRNIAGKPDRPERLHRGDSVSPGTPIVTKIPGLDDQDAFDRTGLVPPRPIWPGPTTQTSPSCSSTPAPASAS